MVCVEEDNTMKKPGIVQTIILSLQEKPRTKEELLMILEKKFPHKRSSGMKRTINCCLYRYSEPKDYTKTGSLQQMKKMLLKGLSDRRILKTIMLNFPDRKKESLKHSLIWLKSDIKQMGDIMIIEENKVYSIKA